MLPRSKDEALPNSSVVDVVVSAALVDAHTQLEVTERRQIVRAALEKLAERDRTILLMKAEGFSLQEIAQVIGTRPGSVGTLAARALERLARGDHVHVVPGMRRHWDAKAGRGGRDSTVTLPNEGITVAYSTGGQEFTGTHPLVIELTREGCA